MGPIRHILVATDFSEPASRAVAAAVLLARRFGARLTMAHVVQPYPVVTLVQAPAVTPGLQATVVRNAEEQLERLHAEALPEAVDAKLEVLVEMSPAGALADYAESNGVDLLVLGTRGLGGFARLLLGSVAQQAVRHAPCPVLTLGAEVLDEDSLARGVAVGVDLTDGSEPALEAGRHIAGALGLGVTVVHARDPAVPYPAPTTVREAFAKPELVTAELERRLAALCEAHAPAGAPAAFELLDDEDSADALVAYAERTQPGLLVLATHGRTGFQRTLRGSISEEVMRRAACPVLTVQRAP